MIKLKKSRTLFISILILTFIATASQLPAQDTGQEAGEDEDQAEELMEFMEEGMKEIDLYTLEELLDTVIVSASKSEETSFEAPISSTVITKTEIEKTGATTISEALRLAPGLMVFEQTNGNYDIHIRGFNHVPPNTDIVEGVNTITLVMIDGRPVFNYFSGGTIWETFPIDLNDVERIEVVRGASSALYGPNAASGVINIITRRNPEEGLYSVANVQGGNYSTCIGNASAGYNFGDLSIIVSGNYQSRDRFSNSYLVFSTEEYVADPADIMMTTGFIPLSWANNDHDIDKMYPDPEMSLDKKAGNLFVTYKPDNEISLDLSTGYQSSTAQASLIENAGTSLSFRTSETGYAHLIADLFDFTGQFSYYGGTLDTCLGVENTMLGTESDIWKHDVNVAEGLFEYNYKMDTLMLRPGISYRKVIYDGEYIGGEQDLVNTAAFIRAEYTFFDAWRLITALRGDKYNHPDDTYFSYQFITTYRFNESNISRASHSRAHREAFMNKTYLDFNIDAQTRILALRGNKDLDLLTIDVSEIGHKIRVTEKVELDLAAFYTTADDFSVMHTTYIDDDVREMRYDNIGMKARQAGATLSCGLILKKIQAKIFGTYQRTELDDYLAGDVNDLNDVEDTDDYSGTPSFYGGFYINYQPIARLNLNVNGYYADKYMFDYKQTETNLSGNFDITDTIVLNAKAMYYVWQKSSVFVNCRNVLNREERQFIGGDRISMLILGGAALEI